MILFLALGPRYQPEDFNIRSIFPLEPFSSGLQSKIDLGFISFYLLFLIKSCEYQ